MVPGDDYERYVHTEYEQALERSRQVGKGLKPGKLFQIGVADGLAWYVVTKVNRKTVHVEWRSFQGDRYFDHWLAYGGIFVKDRIEPLVKRMDALDELFGEGSVKRVH